MPHPGDPNRPYGPGVPRPGDFPQPRPGFPQQPPGFPPRERY